MKSNRIRVVLLLSKRGAGLESLLRKSQEDGKSYEIAGALTTAPDSHAIPLLETWGIPWRCNDIHKFYSQRNAKVNDLGLREEFDRRSLDLIAGFQPHYLILFGYIYILSRVILKAYPMRVLNIHDSDLTISNGNGGPKYRGLHSTRDAILTGEASTRSTIHFATEDLDAGPVLALSPPYPVHTEFIRWALKGAAMDALRAYAYAHREWMIQDGWGRLLDTALNILGNPITPSPLPLSPEGRGEDGNVPLFPEEKGKRREAR